MALLFASIGHNKAPDDALKTLLRLRALKSPMSATQLEEGLFLITGPKEALKDICVRIEGLRVEGLVGKE